MAHTPGPWSVNVAESTTGHWGVYDSHDIQIAVTFREPRSDEWEANARLIAAAPELLSLLQRWSALDAGGWAVQRHASEKEELLADTRAAVAKAEGKP